MVNALDFGPDSSAGRDHCVVFLGKIGLNFHIASLHLGVNGYRRIVRET